MKETAVHFGSKKGQEAHPAAEKALRVKVRKGLSTLRSFMSSIIQRGSHPKATLFNLL